MCSQFGTPAFFLATKLSNFETRGGFAVTCGGRDSASTNAKSNLISFSSFEEEIFTILPPNA